MRARNNIKKMIENEKMFASLILFGYFLIFYHFLLLFLALLVSSDHDFNRDPGIFPEEIFQEDISRDYIYFHSFFFGNLWKYIPGIF